MKLNEAYLRWKYRRLCNQQNNILRDLDDVSDRLSRIKQNRLRNKIVDKSNHGGPIKYYVGGVIEPARTNYGELLYISRTNAIIKTQSNKLYETELFAADATPECRIEFLDEETSKAYYEGKLKDGQGVL